MAQEVRDLKTSKKVAVMMVVRTEVNAVAT